MDQRPLFDSAKSLDETDNCKENNDPQQNCATFANNQIYDYLIVIDFEATCWEEAEENWNQPEIIEFPAILLNLKTGNILSEFHQYVLPVEAPELSAFCIELTGISQSIIDRDGITLPVALMLFDKWLKEMISQHSLVLPKTSTNAIQGNCALASWSDWDFGICLLGECERKNITRLLYFDQWIDMKHIYKTWYRYCPRNFTDALDHVGCSFQGRPHSGIDDAKNLAQLAHTMAIAGAPIAITRDLRPYLSFNYL